MPKSFELLSGRKNWPNVNRQFPGFVAALPNLTSACRVAFERSDRFSPEDFSVFGLGRLCFEDFLEIVVLAENGLGYAALKLLRGLYERGLTAAYISCHPDEARSFHDYYFVQARKSNGRAVKVYGEKARFSAEKLKEIDDACQRVAGNYAFEPCSACLISKQGGWTKLSLEATALKVDKILNARFQRRGNNVFVNAYLICADLPNKHIHASMLGIQERLQRTDNGIEIGEDQMDQVHIALAAAHSLMSLVLDTQNEYFGLGLEDQLANVINPDFNTAWYRRLM